MDATRTPSESLKHDRINGFGSRDHRIANAQRHRRFADGDEHYRSSANSDESYLRGNVQNPEDRDFAEDFFDDVSIEDPEFEEIVREELRFLAQFIQGTAFYAESLEQYLGESLEDFWQAREHAYHIVTTYLIQHACS